MHRLHRSTLSSSSSGRASRCALAPFLASALALAACEAPSPAEGEGEGEGEGEPVGEGEGEGEAAGEDFAACAAVDEPILRGTFIEPAPPIDVAVPVTLTFHDGDAFGFTSDDGVLDLAFASSGSGIAPPVGDVVARFAAVDVGEGSASGYLRLSDDDGTWFEGGVVRTINGRAEGGAALAAPFSLGAVVKTCAPDDDDSDFDDGGTVHAVRVAFDDGEVEVASGETVDGVIDGQPVSVFAGRARTIRFTNEEAVPDSSFVVGDNVITELQVHAFRRQMPPDEPGEDFLVCAANASLLLGIGSQFIPDEALVDIDVVVDEEADTATVTFADGPNGFPILGPFTIPLRGHQLDLPAPPVRVTGGIVFNGEDSGYGYLRLVDDNGLWIEGGISGSFDGRPEGGSLIDGPFALGAVTKTCAPDADLGDFDDGGTVHDIRVTFDDGSIVIDPGESRVGVVDGVTVAVIAEHANTVRFWQEWHIEDLYNVGEHEIEEVHAIAFRTVQP